MDKREAYKQYLKNPKAETFRMIWSMQESIPKLVEAAVKRLAPGNSSVSKDEIVKEAKNELMQDLPSQIAEASAKLARETLRGNDGKPGRTPQRGVDYFTNKDISLLTTLVTRQLVLPKDGKDGTTPVAGEDYPSEEQIKEFVEEEVEKKVIEMAERFITQESMNTMFSKFMQTFGFETVGVKIARALEKLTKGDRLDYEALKNRPGIPMYDQEASSSKKIVARGGGTDIQYYDLTDETDGVTKTFTIPANKRVLGVFGTQFPVQYRPVTDWTATTTQLTLTDEVGAPQTGQTLWIMYVPI